MKTKQQILIFAAGGLAYPLIEILWRGYSHFSMVIAGGISLLLIDRICCRKLRERRLFVKCCAGSGIITGVELFTGLVVNKLFRLGVWDYSSLPFHLAGQICLPFSLVWFFLSIPAVFLCEKIALWAELGAIGKKQLTEPAAPLPVPEEKSA